MYKKVTTILSYRMEPNLSDKCRVCLCDDKQLHYLFTEFDKGLSLRDILTNTTGFEVDKNDGFSYYLCQNCTTIVVNFYNLKAVYEENENQIKSLISGEQNIDVSAMSDEAEHLPNKDVDKFKEVDNVVDDEINDYITIKVECCDSESDECTMNDTDPKQSHLYTASSHDNPDDISTNEDYEFQEINTYTCPECGDCFLYKNEIHTHLISKHDVVDVEYDEISELSVLKVRKDNGTSTNKCKVCNQYFENSDVYRSHLETHKKNVCDICGVGFIRKSYLKDHQEVHCTEKRHVCNYCNKAFKRRTVLVKHKRIHTHPRECICEICGKAFNDKGTLKTHIMLLHVRERNYMCLICGVRFPLKATLEKHIRRHQNKEREFFCSQCPLGYRDKSSLDRHVYVKHSGQNVKSICPDCGKQYTTLSNLFKHQRMCHNIVSKTIVAEQDE